MKVKIINEIQDFTATRLVNEFLDSIRNDYEVVGIEYRTASTNHTAWNCVIIFYKNRE